MTPIPGVPIFRWCPTPDASGTFTLRALSVQFGDGYRQDVGDGINTASQSWPVQFMGRPDLVAQIRTFLLEREGFKSFHWTPPDGELLLFVCRSFSYRRSSPRVATIGATFEQTFTA
jgi:phage-related protein